eukprot:3100046-Rhodomonas_salina.2
MWRGNAHGARGAMQAIHRQDEAGRRKSRRIAKEAVFGAPLTPPRLRLRLATDVRLPHIPDSPPPMRQQWAIATKD